MTDLLRLCRRFEQIQEEQKRLKEEMDSIKLELREHGDGRIGFYRIKVSRRESERMTTSIKKVTSLLKVSPFRLHQLGLTTWYKYTEVKVSRLATGIEADVSEFDGPRGRRLILD